MVLNLCSLIHVFPISDDVMYFFNDNSSQSVSLTVLKKQNILKQHSQFLVKSLDLAQSQANKILKLISVDSGVVGLKEMAKDDFFDKARIIITHYQTRKKFQMFLVSHNEHYKCSSNLRYSLHIK